MLRPKSQQFCESEYGSNLASIHSGEEQWLVYYMMINSGKYIKSYGVYIGALGHGNVWNWTDGTPFDYSLSWSRYPWLEPTSGTDEIYIILSLS